MKQTSEYQFNEGYYTTQREKQTNLRKRSFSSATAGYRATIEWRDVQRAVLLVTHTNNLWYPVKLALCIVLDSYRPQWKLHKVQHGHIAFRSKPSVWLTHACHCILSQVTFRHRPKGFPHAKIQMQGLTSALFWLPYRRLQLSDKEKSCAYKKMSGYTLRL